MVIDEYVPQVDDVSLVRGDLQLAVADGLVRLITDDEKSHDLGSDVKRLAAAGIPVRMDREADHMHHKFAVVDGTVLVNGSYNWTRGATNNWENLHLTSSRRVVEPFQEEFERLCREFLDRDDPLPELPPERSKLFCGFGELG